MTKKVKNPGWLFRLEKLSRMWRWRLCTRVVGETNGWLGMVDWEEVNSSILRIWPIYKIYKSRCQEMDRLAWSEEESELSRTFRVTSIRYNWIYENYSGIEHMKRIQYLSECFLYIFAKWGQESWPNFQCPWIGHCRYTLPATPTPITLFFFFLMLIACSYLTAQVFHPFSSILSHHILSRPCKTSSFIP